MPTPAARRCAPWTTRPKATRHPRIPVRGEREALEPLADALQKIALDRALMAFGLPAKYQTSPGNVSREQARAWLAFARQMGEERLLCRHPLNPRLFSAAMLAAMPHLT